MINTISQSQYNLHQTQEGINDFISHIYTVALSSAVVARAHFSVNYAHWLYSNTKSSQDSITENNQHLAAEGTDAVAEINTVKQKNSYLLFSKCLPCDSKKFSQALLGVKHKGKNQIRTLEINKA